MISDREALRMLLLVLLVEISHCFPTYSEYLAQFPHKLEQYAGIEGEQDRRQARYESVIASYASITEYVPGVNEYTDWYE